MINGIACDLEHIAIPQARSVENIIVINLQEIHRGVAIVEVATNVVVVKGSRAASIATRIRCIGAKEGCDRRTWKKLILNTFWSPSPGVRLLQVGGVRLPGP